MLSKSYVAGAFHSVTKKLGSHDDTNTPVLIAVAAAGSS